MDLDSLDIDAQMAALEREMGGNTGMSIDDELALLEAEEVSGQDDFEQENTASPMIDAAGDVAVTVQPKVVQPKQPSPPSPQKQVKTPRSKPKPEPVVASEELIAFRRLVLQCSMVLLKKTRSTLLQNLKNAPPPSEREKLIEYIRTLGQCELLRQKLDAWNRNASLNCLSSSSSNIKDFSQPTAATYATKFARSNASVYVMAPPVFRTDDSPNSKFSIDVQNLVLFDKQFSIRDYKRSFRTPASEREYEVACEKAKTRGSKRVTPISNKMILRSSISLGDDEISGDNSSIIDPKKKDETPETLDVSCNADELYETVAQRYIGGKGFHIGTRRTRAALNVTILKKKNGLFGMCTPPAVAGRVEFPLGILCHKPDISFFAPVFDESGKVVVGSLKCIVTSHDGPIEGFCNSKKYAIPRKLVADSDVLVPVTKQITLVDDVSLAEWLCLDEAEMTTVELTDTNCQAMGTKMIGAWKAKNGSKQQATTTPAATTSAPTATPKKTPVSPPTSTTAPPAPKKKTPWDTWILPPVAGVIASTPSVELLEAAKTQYEKSNLATKNKVVAVIQKRIDELVDLISNEQLSLDEYVAQLREYLNVLEENGLKAGPMGQKRQSLVEADISSSYDE